MTDAEKMQFRWGIKDNSWGHTHSLPTERLTVRMLNVLYGENGSSLVICLRNFAAEFTTMEKECFGIASVQNLPVLTDWCLKYMQINMET